MENNDPKRREDVKDVIGQRGWPQEKGRDGERTPMQWNAGPNAGFNDGTTAWLPVHPNYKRKNVEAQTSEPKSMLNWYRQLIRLRRTHPAFYEGAYLPLLEDNASVLAYARKSKNETAVVLLNMTASRQTVSLNHAQLGGSFGKSLVRTSDVKEIDLRSVTLEPFEVVIAEVGGAR